MTIPGNLNLGEVPGNLGNLKWGNSQDFTAFSGGFMAFFGEFTAILVEFHGNVKLGEFLGNLDLGEFPRI